jgi:ribosome-binding factor A
MEEEKPNYFTIYERLEMLEVSNVELSRDLEDSKKYSQYLADQINSLIAYTEYLAERLEDHRLKYHTKEIPTT